MKWLACLWVGLVFTAAPAGADSWSFIDDDDDVAIMQEVANTLADVEAWYGTGPLVARTGWVGDRDTYAEAVGDGITVNKVWSTGTYEALAAALNVDIATGYHHSGCPPIRTLALHEAAHVINYQRNGVPVMRARLEAGYGPRPDLRDDLSGYSFDEYGSVDPGEAIAEAFTAVVCGSASLAERQLYDMLVN